MSKRVQGCFGVLCAAMLASCEGLLGPPESVNETAECPSVLSQEGVELVLASPQQVPAGGDFVLEVRRDGVLIEVPHDRGPLDWKGRPWLRPAYDEESQPMVRMTDGLVYHENPAGRWYAEHRFSHRGRLPGRHAVDMTFEGFRDANHFNDYNNGGPGPERWCLGITVEVVKPVP